MGLWVFGGPAVVTTLYCGFSGLGLGVGGALWTNSEVEEGVVEGNVICKMKR